MEESMSLLINEEWCVMHSRIVALLKANLYYIKDDAVTFQWVDSTLAKLIPQSPDAAPDPWTCDRCFSNLNIRFVRPIII